MWPFKKKEDTIESLMKDCNKLYSSFKFSLTLAHYHDYFTFKSSMVDNFNFMKTHIGSTNEEDILKSLLLHFKDQLQFFEKNPFSCSSEDFQDFENKHLPYKNKIESIIREKASVNCKIKM